MAVVVSEFLGVIGAEAAPTCMEELIPYLITITIGVFLVSAVFRVLSGALNGLTSARKY